jgi:hypothetical protein
MRGCLLSHQKMIAVRTSELTTIEVVFMAEKAVK